MTSEEKVRVVIGAIGNTIMENFGDYSEEPWTPDDTLLLVEFILQAHVQAARTAMREALKPDSN